MCLPYTFPNKCILNHVVKFGKTNLGQKWTTYLLSVLWIKFYWHKIAYLFSYHPWPFLYYSVRVWQENVLALKAKYTYIYQYILIDLSKCQPKTKSWKSGFPCNSSLHHYLCTMDHPTNWWPFESNKFGKVI